jgi:bifunctional DNA-binding transcriptional regulator/antitoxin component of YhaV-PrlF toxin-antitoxin module
MSFFAVNTMWLLETMQNLHYIVSIMVQSTITEKFQTTIPVAVRQALRLKPRQRVSYEVRQDGSAILRPEPGLDELFGCIKLRKPVASAQTEKLAARRAMAGEAALEGQP